MTQRYSWDENTKDAYIWAFGIHPVCIGFPGIEGDLYFSSIEKFDEVIGLKRIEESDGYETLVKVKVPKDFDDWDYCPDNY